MSSLLHETFVKSTVLIKSSGKNPIGSWFLVWFKNWFNDSQEQLYSLFLVTNLHVIKADPNIIHICMNKKSWWVWEPQISTQDPNWILYDWVDIAMIQINWDFLLEWEYATYFINEEMIITNPEQYLSDLEMWEEIYLLWFPLWISWLSLHNPIVRQWIIARIDEELITQHQIYFDVNNFPWNSWWPVIIKPNIMSLQGKLPREQSKLIWLINAYIPFKKVYYDNDKNPPEPTMMVSENSWIWIWIPSYIIAELAHQHLEKAKNTPN